MRRFILINIVLSMWLCSELMANTSALRQRVRGVPDLSHSLGRRGLTGGGVNSYRNIGLRMVYYGTLDGAGLNCDLVAGRGLSLGTTVEEFLIEIKQTCEADTTTRKPPDCQAFVDFLKPQLANPKCKFFGQTPVVIIKK